jgi:valyl-tRNA synthetase
VVAESTVAFQEFDYARSLERTEAFFWSFCDDYLELVKTRAYGDPADPGTASARGALVLALSVQLRLLAPFLPFVTEEVWSWWQVGSIHTSAWPGPAEFDPALAGAVWAPVRRPNTTAKRSMRSPVAALTVTDTPDRIAALRSAEGDVRDAGGVVDFDTAEGDEFVVEVELGPEE